MMLTMMIFVSENRTASYKANIWGCSECVNVKRRWADAKDQKASEGIAGLVAVLDIQRKEENGHRWRGGARWFYKELHFGHMDGMEGGCIFVTIFPFSSMQNCYARLSKRVGCAVYPFYWVIFTFKVSES